MSIGAGVGGHGDRGLGSRRAGGARALLAITPFVMVLHPNAWQWSGHTRADLDAIIATERLTVVPLSGQAEPLGDYGQVVLEPRGPAPSVLARGPGEW